MATIYDAVVIGGGFFGCMIAKSLVTSKGFRKVKIIERESELLARASRWNQARVHAGFHYPRDRVTAYRSQKSLARFNTAYPHAVSENHTALYAIARRGSKVNARTFVNRMNRIGARLATARKEHLSLFSESQIEAVFEVHEPVFDAHRLRQAVAEEIAELNIETDYESEVIHVNPASGVSETIAIKGETPIRTLSKYVFNCSYGGFVSENESNGVSKTPIKHEECQIALLNPPTALRDLAITVMDGPFFSVMPFPMLGCVSLSHVRYTPRPSQFLEKDSNFFREVGAPTDFGRTQRMLLDASRYVPLIKRSELIGVFQENKTIMANSEKNDDRPIFFARSSINSHWFTVIGAKIDTVFDAIEVLEKLELEPHVK